jgi:hypothetical protein
MELGALIIKDSWNGNAVRAFGNFRCGEGNQREEIGVQYVADAEV